MEDIIVGNDIYINVFYNIFLARNSFRTDQEIKLILAGRQMIDLVSE